MNGAKEDVMYDKIPTDLKLVEWGKEVEKFWEAKHIFKKSIRMREGCKPYVFYDGPPTANGKPHIGHVETRAIKDMIPRYRAMKGYMVLRKAGWDIHDPPVELEVEEKLGLGGKEQIEQCGLEPFIKEYKESAWKYRDMWEDFSNTVGFRADIDDPYVTYDNSSIKSGWWALKQIWNKGPLYKSSKAVPHCPRCGTPLSSHEVVQGHKDVKERSVTARSKAKGEDMYTLAWITTPWTLLSNLALCVNPKEDYVKVKIGGGYTYYITQALADTVLGEDYEVLGTYKGGDLGFKEYEPLYDCSAPLCEKQHKKAYYVVCADYVTLTDGTGVVYIAPALGEDDVNADRKYDLPFVQLVDIKGDMTANMPSAGTFVKDVDPMVLEGLEPRGLLLPALSSKHSYPHYWCCGTPLVYYAREPWFIKMTAVKDDPIRNNNIANWVPDSIGKGRFGDWLEDIQDWGISRNRYWGTPLNIWGCEYGHQHSIGSIEELKSLSDNCPDKTELHRPYIDAVNVKYPKCNKPMKRVPEVIDYWSDFGAMPFAQRHYPFENKELFESQFPAQFIPEAVDQIRGWFYSPPTGPTLLSNKAPYENVAVMGLVLDENGQKMSKSKGNVVDPLNTLAAHGADAIRWFFYIRSAPRIPKRYQDKAVTEGQRKFMGTLRNTHAFWALYADIDNFDPTGYIPGYNKLPVMDRWILSKMNSVVRTVDNNLMNYQIPEAARSFQEFVDDSSNWYVHRSCERFWAKGMEQDKINVFITLYTVPVTVVKAAAPMIPLMTEQIYRNVVRKVDGNAPESIHLCDFPEVNESWIDVELEFDMDEVLKVVVMGRAARNVVNTKNRQPIARMYVKADHELSRFYVQIIEEELNVKQVIFSDDVREFISYTFEPQLETVGPRYDRLLNRIRQILTDIDGSAAIDTLNEKGQLTFDYDGQEVVLTKDDLLIDVSQKDDYVTEGDNYATVVLDTNLTPELIEEDSVRELINKIQTMCKEAGFGVMDHTSVFQDGNDRIAELIKAHAGEVRTEVMADCINIGAMSGSVKEWSINGENVTFGVEKIMKQW